MPGGSAGAAGRDARLNVPGSSVCAPEWLSLRESADASARAPELVDQVRAHLAAARPGAPSVIRDLGCGTGSMGRWLAGRLPGPQLWFLYDRDPGLLARAGASLPTVAADGAPVTARPQERDLADLPASEFRGTSLVVVSALLDLLTSEEVEALATVCVAAGCPALMTLTVDGTVELDTPDPLDAAFGAAFNSHQRRSSGGRRQLGPDAGPAAVDAFARRGWGVRTAPSPWRLGAREAELAEEWLRGWVGAACLHRPDLERHADAYLRARLDACAAGVLRVVVGHVDVLAVPGGAS